MTTKDLIREHNALAEQFGLPPLQGWKASKEALQARIDGLMTQQPIDPLAIPEAFGDVEPDTVSPIGAEEPGDADQELVAASGTSAESAEALAESAEATKVAKGSIGKLVASLLLDAEGFDYPAIVEMVTGEFPAAHTSPRSIASVAAALRRKGVEVPMRRKPRSAKA